MKGKEEYNSRYEFALDQEWEFPRDLLELGPVLGEGAFGKVSFFYSFDSSENKVVTFIADHFQVLKGEAHCTMFRDDATPSNQAGFCYIIIYQVSSSLSFLCRIKFIH